jgi:hypothetical protein
MRRANERRRWVAISGSAYGKYYAPSGSDSCFFGKIELRSFCRPTHPEVFMKKSYSENAKS